MNWRRILRKKDGMKARVKLKAKNGRKYNEEWKKKKEKERRRVTKKKNNEWMKIMKKRKRMKDRTKEGNYNWRKD